MIINVSNAHPNVKFAKFPLEKKRTYSSWCVTKDNRFLKKRENQSKILLEKCSAQIWKRQVC